MRVNIAQTTPPSFSPPSTPHKITSSSHFFHLHRSQSTIFGSSLKFSHARSTAQILRRSCSASFDGYDFNNHHNPFEDTNTHFKNKNHFHVPTSSFNQPCSQLKVIQPSFLGIRPEPPDWPAREELIRESIARRASSIELPLSLRMIKMKQRFEKLEQEREIKDLDENVEINIPISNLCYSTLFIVKEIQSQALKIRGLVLDEELHGVVGKVQKEMTSSFVWLFREVFAKTPDLMVQVLIFTSNFVAFSLESYQMEEKAMLEIGFGENLGGNLANSSIESLREKEVGLWNSMVEEAKDMNGGDWKNEGLGFVVDDYDHDNDDDHDLMERKFVSPVEVEIEDDDYEEYDRTDLFYQIGLSQDPNSTLLLSNYAQFLCLVPRDYDRAEECYKRAIQLDSSDAEVISQYANFLWLVRKDLMRAEERFQQAITAEPNNSYHASKYANFLWSTGGEDTCYPLDPPHSTS